MSKIADNLIEKDTYPEDPDHECVEFDGEETGLCNECRDHASFCDVCKLSNCCAAKEMPFDVPDVDR
jgi:hypothetical protein